MAEQALGFGGGMRLSDETASRSFDVEFASDYVLASRAAAGEGEAFAVLYRRHFKRVHALCLRMTANAAEAEDLRQEVFVSLWRKIGTFRGEAAFTTWLHRFTVNQVLMYWRKRRARPEGSLEEGGLPAKVALVAGRPKQTPVIDRIIIERAVASLPPGYRNVFKLYDVEGYEHKEVARLLGISEGTSKSQLHRARLKLRSLIGQRTALNQS
jgi:RNA polymerase sigma-70 factor (ECF subfamily)